MVIKACYAKLTGIIFLTIHRLQTLLMVTNLEDASLNFDFSYNVSFTSASGEQAS